MKHDSWGFSFASKGHIIFRVHVDRPVRHKRGRTHGRGNLYETNFSLGPATTFWVPLGNYHGEPIF